MTARWVLVPACALGVFVVTRGVAAQEAKPTPEAAPADPPLEKPPDTASGDPVAPGDVGVQEEPPRQGESQEGASAPSVPTHAEAPTPEAPSSQPVTAAAATGAASETDPAATNPPSEPAESQADEDDDSGLGAAAEWISAIDIHGFVSQGAILSTDNNFLVTSSDGSFEFTEVGINFTKPLSERMQLGLQLFARDLGPNENYDARFDWFYLDYRFADWLGIRAGRAKTPFGLYNEASDIDAARNPVLLPQSVYPTVSRDFLLAVTGAHLYGYLPIGVVGALEYRAYGGTNFLRTVDRPSSPSRVEGLETPFVVGGRLLWETPLTGLELAGSVEAIRIDSEQFLTPEGRQPYIDSGAVPADFDGFTEIRLDAVLALASLGYTYGDFSAAAEYGRWVVDFSVTPVGLIPTTSLTSEQFYAMASYRITDWLTPSAYYSFSFPNAEVRIGRENQQHDVAATLRFDLTDHWLFKIEGHYMYGTALLDPALNDGTPRNALVPEWGLFLAKTTAYF